MNHIFLLVPAIFLISIIPQSLAQQQESQTPNFPIEFTIEIIRDFDQTFSFNASYFDTDLNSTLKKQPLTEVTLIDPNNSIIVKELSSDEINIAYVPPKLGEYKIKLQISKNELDRYDWSSIFLDTTITTQNTGQPAGSSTSNYLKQVYHDAYSADDMENIRNYYEAKNKLTVPLNSFQVTKITFPQGPYELKQSNAFKDKITKASIPLIKLKENYEKKTRLEEEAKKIATLTDEQILAEYKNAFADIEEFSKSLITEITPVSISEKNSKIFDKSILNTLSEKMGRISLLSAELEKRGYKIGVVWYIEQSKGMLGIVVFTPELHKLEGELETAVIPKWFKESSKFYTRGAMSDIEYYNALQFLVTKEQIKIPSSYQKMLEDLTNNPASEGGITMKAFTSLWLNGEISDNIFALGIQELLMTAEIKKSEEYLSGDLQLVDYPINTAGLYGLSKN